MNDNLAETSSVSSQYDFAEYAQALAFDQLRKIMEAGQAFIGFQEGRIDFPPTFKYDVLRTVKRSKHSLKRPAKAVVAESLAHDKMLTEIEEQEREEREGLLRADEGDDDDEGGEATSIASSMYTSVGSRQTGDADDREADPEEPEEFFTFSPDTIASTRANAQSGNAVHKILAVSAAHKAKAKWMSIVHKHGHHRPWNKLRRKVDGDQHPQTPLSPSFAVRSATLLTTPEPTPGTSSTQIAGDEVDDKYLKPIRTSGSGRNSPTKSRRKSDEMEEPEDEDKGVYDSSHKQRVPSW